jgi:hypothetical protein
MGRLKKSFDEFRLNHPARECPPERIDNDDQLRQLAESEGLEQMGDGPGAAVQGATPKLEKNDPNIRLWVVRAADVVHAQENITFGASLVSGVIKHTNLTGGEPAHSGGQIVIVSVGVLALDGGSGRYGPQSEEEMTDVAKAFTDAGYGVWSYGYDEESGWAFRIGSKEPEWVK